MQTNRTFSYIALLILFASYLPLTYSQGSRSYWDFSPSFEGVYRAPFEAPYEQRVQLGSASSNSWVSGVWDVFPHTVLFMNEEMKKHTKAELHVSNSPVSLRGSYRQAFFEGNFSRPYPEPDGWGVFDGDGTVSRTRVGVAISPDDSKGYVLYGSKQSASYDSVRENTVRLRIVNATGILWHLVMTINGTVAGLYDTDGVYVHSSSGTFIFRIPPNVYFQDPGVYVVNSRLKTSSSVEIDWIEFSEPEGQPVRVSVNGLPVLNSSLTLERDGIFTLEGVTAGPTQIPVPTSILTVHDEVDITIGPYVTWNVTSVLLTLNTPFRSENPIWQSYALIIFSAFAAGTIWLVQIFRNWHRYLSKSRP